MVYSLSSLNVSTPDEQEGDSVDPEEDSDEDDSYHDASLIKLGFMTVGDSLVYSSAPICWLMVLLRLR